MAKRHIVFVALAVAALALVGCDNAAEQGRTIVSVEDFNNNQPVQSDVQDTSGASPTIVEDIIPVTFFSRAYNDFVTMTTTSPHSEVVVESYRVDWTRTDGGTGALASHEDVTTIAIPLNIKTDGAIRLVTWDDKNNPILTALVGTANQVEMRADITFHAREVGSEHKIEFKAQTTVHFADVLN